MAKLKKIAKGKGSAKGTPPIAVETNNLNSSVHSEGDKILNFKVSDAFKKEFKQLALTEDKTMRELFMAMYYAYTEK